LHRSRSAIINLSFDYHVDTASLVSVHSGRKVSITSIGKTPMPMTFPAHQGLILPVVRRWPNSFDALALSVGAAMPDITDTILGFSINGYFKQWHGHSLIGIFTLDLAGGLFITWLIAVLVRRSLKSVYIPKALQAFLTKAPPTHHSPGNRLKLWSFSVMVGILSHVFFDLISHDTNLLFYPWYENVYWFPTWWYTIWFEVRPVAAFGRTYAVGVFTIFWGLLTLLGSLLFLRFLSQEYEKRD
jgi:Domain of unknown function (DUF4184)